MELHSYEATQKGSGANMSVDIAANVADAGSGVAAYVKGIGVTAQGPYPIPAHTAVINEAVSAAHATLPRVDQAVLELKDTTHDGGGSNLVQTRVIAGTATSGADLTNRTGAANLATSCPGGCILLADILVGAAVSSLTNANIRDRRKWARGAYWDEVSGGSGDLVVSTGVASLFLTRRIECSGAPIEVMFAVPLSAASSGAVVYAEIRMDATQINGASATFEAAAAAQDGLLQVLARVSPAAGSHLFQAVATRTGGSGNITYKNSGADLYSWVIIERVRQKAANNMTTSG